MSSEAFAWVGAIERQGGVWGHGWGHCGSPATEKPHERWLADRLGSDDRPYVTPARDVPGRPKWFNKEPQIVDSTGVSFFDVPGGFSTSQRDGPRSGSPRKPVAPLEAGVTRHVNYVLEPATIDSAKAKDKRYALTEGGGLVLEVPPSGSRTWRFKYCLVGRREKGDDRRIGTQAAGLADGRWRRRHRSERCRRTAPPTAFAPSRSERPGRGSGWTGRSGASAACGTWPTQCVEGSEHDRAGHGQVGPAVGRTAST